MLVGILVYWLHFLHEESTANPYEDEFERQIDFNIMVTNKFNNNWQF